jgi:hypothetical protein
MGYKLGDEIKRVLTGDRRWRESDLEMKNLIKRKVRADFCPRAHCGALPVAGGLVRTGA